MLLSINCSFDRSFMNPLKISACKHCGVAEEKIDSSALNTDQTNFNPISVALGCHLFFISGKHFNDNAKRADMWISGDKQSEELDVGSDYSFNTEGPVLYNCRGLDFCCCMLLWSTLWCSWSVDKARNLDQNTNMSVWILCAVSFSFFL